MATPAITSPRKGIPEVLTSRRGAWVALLVGLLFITALFGVFRSADGPSNGAGEAPVGAESTQVQELLQKFPDADKQSVLVVATRTDGSELSGQDMAALEGIVPTLGAHAAGEVQGPVPSEDGRAVVIITPITVAGSNVETGEVIKDMRSEIAEVSPEGLELQVTGGPAFGADVAAAFDGADYALLAVTVAIVAVLLIATYRSPVLFLIPLVVVALADGLAGRVTAAAGSAFGFEFDAGIISVLVFGAGTNYALLLISRYREELQQTDDDRLALNRAWRGTVGAILASNITVVLALLTLVFAVIPMTRGLGVPSALGLLIALAAVLFVLPPFLAVVGRKAFWPFIPRPGTEHKSGGLWRRIATAVVARPAVSLVAGLALLAVMASGLLGASVGLDQMEKFRVQSESAAGLETLSEHFPAGEAQPIWVVAETAETDTVLGAVNGVEGIVRANPAGATEDGSLTRIMVVSQYSPGTDESLAQIAELRQEVHAASDAQVGGQVATDFDAREGADRDLMLIAPLVLLVNAIVLFVLLRSLVAPVLLLLVNMVSAVAAIGAGSFLGRVLFDQNALDLQVPILSFLFLVALGIDYTIFLVHRARHEAAQRGTRTGMVEAVAHTGGVITSAGIVLAGVFAALGVLPLVVLGQLGLIVGVGVLVDTLVVRTIIVPAIFALVGDRIWWPGHPVAKMEEWNHDRGAAHADAQ